MNKTNNELIAELSERVAALVGAHSEKAAAAALRATHEDWLNGCEPSDNIRSLYTATDLLITPRTVGGNADDAVRIKGIVFDNVKAQLKAMVNV